MIEIIRILFIALAVYLIYIMFKNGGCCGSHNTSDRNHHGGHFGGGCCGGGYYNSYTSQNEHQSHSQNIKNNTEINTVKDPVCGMYISKEDAIKRQINGQTYYFCSESCAEKFEDRNGSK